MPGIYANIECPICRSSMSVPRSGGRTVLTCRNGHRFVRERSRGRRRPWPIPGTFMALSISLLLIALFLVRRLPPVPWSLLRLH